MSNTSSNKQIILFVIFFLLEAYFLTHQDSDSILFLQLASVVDIAIFLLCFYRVYTGKISSLFSPLFLFIAVYFVYSFMGKLAWIYRELYWFNEMGNPNEVALIYNVTFIFLLVLSLIISKKKTITKTTDGEQLGSIFLAKHILVGLTILTFIGAFLFTSGFSIIPILSENVDTARVMLGKSESGGRGFAFMLLLCGIHANTYLYYRINYLEKSRLLKLSSLFLLVINVLLLGLYSSRFMILVSFILIFIVHALIKNYKLRVSRILTYSVLVIVIYASLSLFGAVRQFGYESIYANQELLINYFFADTFPEFRMTVFYRSINRESLHEFLLPTIISGIMPGFLFSLLGLDKKEYFQPIGGEILKISGYNPETTPGIRTSLIGEMISLGDYYFLGLLTIGVILYLLHINYMKYEKISNKKYLYLSTGLFFSFSIPYGSIFLISVLQSFILLKILFFYVRSKN